MASYDTWTKTKDDITVTVSKAKDQTAGGRLKAFLEWLSENIVDPGYGVGSERPSHPIAPGGQPPKPDQGLPPSGSGGKPDQGLPGSQPGVDNSLPKEHIDEIVKLILGKCMSCEVAQPK